MNGLLLALALNLTGNEGAFELPLTLASDPRPATAAWRSILREPLLPEVSPFSLDLSLPDRDIVVGASVLEAPGVDLPPAAPSLDAYFDFEARRGSELLTADRSVSEGLPLTSWIAGRSAQEPALKPVTPLSPVETLRQDPWHSIVRTDR